MDDLMDLSWRLAPAWFAFIVLMFVLEAIK